MANNKLPSLLKRDDQGKIDESEAKKTTEQLVKKLITEERAYQKDISFHAKTQKRDVMVFITVAVRNSVDGMVAIGDDESQGFESWSPRDPYKYKVFDYVELDMKAGLLPMSKENIGKQLMSAFAVLTNYLARMGVLRG